MNFYAIIAIYKFEMARTFRTLLQSIISPVISTALYFVVFGSAIGSRMEKIEDIEYGSFIVPGLIAIYFPKFLGTIYEVLSAPVSYVEIIIGYVGAAATKSFIIGIIILVTATLFVDVQVKHPLMMFFLLALTCISFSLFGFILGIWAKSFEQLNLVPMLILTPLVFLGGSFYSIDMLPPVWQQITLFNPVVYLISGLRWSFFGTADVSITYSLIAIGVFTFACVGIISWIFKSGYRLRK